MRPTNQLLCLLLFLLCIQTFAADKLEKGQNLTDGETLVSAGGTFTLGFFSPGVSTKRYLGIWFSVSNDTVYWVANRDDPLGDKSGTLVFNDAGSLVLLDGSRRIAWSSDFPGSATAAVAHVLESGNLVVRNGSSEATLWQSFDNPSDTLLPDMKLGKNFWTRSEWQLTSWRSADDPSPGDYRRTLEISGLPELVLWHRGVKTYRTGPFNGRWFNGVPEASTYTEWYPLHVTTSATETTYGYTAVPDAPLTRVVVNHTGVAERLVWDASSRAWILFFQGPKDECDDYARCGPFGLCDAGAASRCDCVPGFSPASPSAWQLKRYAGGCHRDAVSNCGGGTTTDRFEVVQGVKLPDTQNASVDIGVTLEECKAKCYANCSCLAYAAAHIQEGGNGTGCIIWADTIVDLRLVDRGQNLYLRLSTSEFDDSDGGIRFPTLLVVVSSTSAVTILLVIFLICWIMRRRIVGVIPQNPHMAIHSVNLATIKHVTENFSGSNIIDRDGLWVVCKARLGEGRMIAVERLKQSALTRKSKTDFAREVKVVAGLRHQSLVRLLAYCNQGKDRILVYEYMEKSLDNYIFGHTSNRALLNWTRRLEIILGIAHGVAYLHEGSGESIIHGNLKSGNILLDDEWKPKIANFGTAKLFTADQTGHDQLIIVSPEYVAPEYALGEMTQKCDVYSFGIIILETLSGKRNDDNKSLLLDVSGLCHNVIELLDKEMGLLHPDSEHELMSKLKQCIVIGLHCVQDMPGDRPSMSDIVAMLTITTSQIDLPTMDSMKTSWSHDPVADPSSSNTNCVHPSIN